MLSSQWYSSRQSSSSLHSVTHDTASAQTRPMHITGGPPDTQSPLASHTGAGVSAPASQLASPHVSPLVSGLQLALLTAGLQASHASLGLRSLAARHAPSIRQPAPMVLTQVLPASSQASMVQSSASSQLTVLPVHSPAPSQLSLVLQNRSSPQLVPGALAV